MLVVSLNLQRYHVDLPAANAVWCNVAAWGKEDVWRHLATLKGLLDLMEDCGDLNGPTLNFYSRIDLYTARALDEGLGTNTWESEYHNIMEELCSQECPKRDVLCKREPLASVEHNPLPYDWDGDRVEEVTGISKSSLMIRTRSSIGPDYNDYGMIDSEGWCPCASCRARVPTLSEVESMH